MTTPCPRPRHLLSERRSSPWLLGSFFAAVLALGACSGELEPPDPPPEIPQQGVASLLDLSLSEGTLRPAFSPSITLYNVDIPFDIRYTQITARTQDPRASVRIGGVEIPSGRASSPFELYPEVRMISVEVNAPGGVSSRYDLVVRKSALTPRYVKASNTGADDTFGNAVALSGDTLAVGASQEDSAATGVNGDQADDSRENSGAVYIFRRNGASWTQEAYLKASNPDAEDEFGLRVALSGDTLAVGALFEDSAAMGVNGDQMDNSAKDSGAVYIFHRSGTRWIQQAYLKAANAGAGDLFGLDVSLSGDTLAVSAFNEDSRATGVNGDQANDGAEDSGAVYLFARSGTEWTQQAYLKASNTEKDDHFGHSISLFGDTLAVSAPEEDSRATGANGDSGDNSAPGSGAVYVFKRSGTEWTQQAYLKASNTEQGDEFGYRLSLFGDTLAVSAFFESSAATGVGGHQGSNTASFSGAVYAFRRTGNAWAQEAYIKASNTGRTDGFGSAMAVFGDMLAVGAQSEESKATGIDGDQSDNSLGNAGAAYLFRRTGRSWKQIAYLKPQVTEGGDLFGFSTMALSADTVAIGMAFEDGGATGVDGDPADNSAAGSGAVYLFQHDLPF